MVGRARKISVWVWLWLLLVSTACQPLPAVPVTAPAEPTHTPAAAPVLPSATASPLPPSAKPSQSERSTATDPAPTDTPTASPSPTATPQTSWRFAVIGDYGLAGQAEADVAALVSSWQPDLILTLGDNNYPGGAADTIDENIGQYYAAYIAPYQGKYGTGAEQNRFFPALGNHDLNTDLGQAYFDYFTLPNNERYYDFTSGPVHFFVLNSDAREPDGVGRSSIQAAWLQQRLAESTAPWQVVVMHHPAYTSGLRGPVDWMRWPFAAWGADAVLAGHDHFYERLEVDGLPYLINGLGGGAIYPFGLSDAHSQVRYNADHGALLISTSQESLKFEFYTRSGLRVDQLELLHPREK